ncbi:hypothetical protein [Aegicerativicinus sediminis]
MKSLKFLSLLIVFVCIFSCSGDDGPGEPTIEDTIVGNWVASDFDVSGDVTGNIGGINVTVDLVGEVYDNTYRVQFAFNPNDVTSSGDFSVEFSANFLGQTYTEDIQDVQFIGSGEWEIQGNQLIISTDLETRTFDIQTINATTLRVLGEINVVIDVEDTPANAVIDLDLTFTRV